MKPRYIVSIIWIIIALLAIVCWCMPQGGVHIGKYTLHWPTLTEVLEPDNSQELDTTWIAESEDFNILDITDGDTLSVPVREVRPLEPKFRLIDSVIDSVTDSVVILPVDTTATKVDTLVESKVIVFPPSDKPQSTNSDTRNYLAAFYQALDSAEVMPIRVIHYGDSQIEEDRITDILRERWQGEYGGGGVGLIPLHQTIPTRGIRQWITINGIKQSAKGGPKRYLIYGSRSMRQEGNDYGMMGQVAIMDSLLVSGSQQVTLYVESIGKKHKPHKYFNRIQLFAEDIKCNIMTAGTTIEPTTNHRLFYLPDSTTKCQIQLQGKGKVYGISLETSTGVMVDNIPMRGCSGTIFTRLNSSSLSNYFYQTNTRLIIMQYGGNMIPQSKTTSAINNYVNNLRQQVRRIRACAPYASILFIGPSDMSTRLDGKMATYPMVPYLDKQLKKMAAEEHIAYWSIYDAMGGQGSMITWVEKDLAGKDYVHFTRAGANKVGNMLVNWIDNGKKIEQP